MLTKIVRCHVWILALVVFAGCAPYSKELVADFEDSNQVLVEQTVDELDLASVVETSVPAGSSVALVSLERQETSDEQLQTLIEDRHISHLLDRGYTVLERDGDMLRRLVAESDTVGHALYWFPERGWWSMEGRSSSFSSEDTSVPYGAHYGQSFGASAASVSGAESVAEPNLVRTGLRQADYLVSYRILELGVLFGDREDEDESVEREARARVHVRIQAAEDGRIVRATDLMATRTDRVDRRLASVLSNFHYTPYSHGLPVSRSTESFPTSRRVSVKTDATPESDDNSRVIAILALVGLVVTAAAVSN